MTTQVVVWRSGTREVAKVDLWTATIEQFFNEPMTLAYYFEFDDHVTFSGMQSTASDLKVFVKLVDGEPIDMSVDEFDIQWQRHPELIPLDI